MLKASSDSWIICLVFAIFLLATGAIQSAIGQMAELVYQWPIFGASIFASVVFISAGTFVTVWVTSDQQRIERVNFFLFFVPGMKRVQQRRFHSQRKRQSNKFSDQLRDLKAEETERIVRLRQSHESLRQEKLANYQQEQKKLNQIIASASRELEDIIKQTDECLKNEKLNIRFECPHCDRKLRFDSRKAGRIVTCPNHLCRRRVRLPSPKE